MTNDPTRSVPPPGADPTLSAPPVPSDGETGTFGPPDAQAGPSAFGARLEALAGLDATRDGPSACGASPVPQLPGYELLGELGRGGMGVVYRAREVALNRTVALKMVLAGPYAHASTRARFLIEAESVASIQHPHIVQVFAYGEHGGHSYLAMEYLPGGTLADRIKAHGPLPPLEAARVAAKLAEAMAAAHAAGVVHRDLKPQNVLLTEGGEPKVTDFGLAKVGRSDMTATGAVLGTPSYMAPEQAAGKTREVGTAADVYGLGAILYDLLTGRPPFKGDSQAATIQLVLTSEPVRPRTVNGGVPRDLETICLKCLEKEPGKRYPTAQALAEDLRRFLAGEPVLARPVGRAEQAWRWCRRNKAVASLLAAVLLVFATGAGVAGYFAVEEANRAKEADDNAQRANENATRADDNARRAAEREREANDERNNVLAEQQKLRAEQDRTRRLVHLNQMNNASFALTNDRIDQVARWLNAARPGPGEPDLRGWEWHFLDNFTRVEASEFSVPAHGVPDRGNVGGDLATTDYASLTPDGRRLVLRSLDGKVMALGVWDTTTGRRVAEIRTPVPPGYSEDQFTVNLPVISPDGTHIAFAVPTEEAGPEPKPVPPKKNLGRDVQPPKSRKYRVRVWDVATGKEVSGPTGEFADVNQLRLGAAAGWMAWVERAPDPVKAAPKSGPPPAPPRHAVYRWDRETGQVTRRAFDCATADNPGTVAESVVLTADGNSLVCIVDKIDAPMGLGKGRGASAETRFEVWETCAEPFRRRWHTEWRRNGLGVFSPSLGGRTLVVETEGGFTVHRLDDGKIIWVATARAANRSPYQPMGVSDDGTRVLVQAGNKGIGVLDRDDDRTNAPARVKSLDANAGGLFPILTADGKVVVTPNTDGNVIQVWGSPDDPLRDPARPVRWESSGVFARCAVSPDFRVVAEYYPSILERSGYWAHFTLKLRIRDVATGKLLGTIAPLPGYRLKFPGENPKKVATPGQFGGGRQDSAPLTLGVCDFAPDGKHFLVRHQKIDDADKERAVVYTTAARKPVASWDVSRKAVLVWLGPWIVETEGDSANQVARDSRTGEMVPGFPRRGAALVPDPSGERLAQMTGRGAPPLNPGWFRFGDGAALALFEPNRTWAALVEASGGTVTIKLNNVPAAIKDSLRRGAERLGTPVLPDTGEWNRAEFLAHCEVCRKAVEAMGLKRHARGVASLFAEVPLSTGSALRVTAVMVARGDFGSRMSRGGTGELLDTDTLGVRLFDARTGREIWARSDLGRPAFDGGNPVFSPGGRLLAVLYRTTGGSKIWVGRAADGADERMFDLPHEAGAFPGSIGPAPVFSPDGRRLAAFQGKEARVWDIGTGALLCRLSGDEPIAWAAFTSDGTRLLTAPSASGRQSQASVWDLVTGRELISIPLPGTRGGGFNPNVPVFRLVGEKFCLKTDQGIWVFDGTPAKNPPGVRVLDGPPAKGPPGPQP